MIQEFSSPMRCSFFPLALNHRINIRAARHEHGRDDAADQALSGIENLPSSLELVVKARLLQHVPGFVRSDALQALQHRIGHLRPAVRKTLAVPVRRERNSLFGRKQAELCVSGDGEKRGCCQRGCREADRAKAVCAQGSPASRSEFEPLGKISQRPACNNTSMTEGQR